MNPHSIPSSPVIHISPEASKRLDEAFGIKRGTNMCPTCRAVGDETCVRGRFPSPNWEKKIPFPEGHDSRRTANALKVGDRVTVINSLLYTGRTGVLEAKSDDPEDFWDFTVVLDHESMSKNTRRIGVATEQLVKAF